MSKEMLLTDNQAWLQRSHRQPLTWPLVNCHSVMWLWATVRRYTRDSTRVLIFEIRSHFVAKAVLEPDTLLSPPSRNWNYGVYRHTWHSRQLFANRDFMLSVALSVRNSDSDLETGGVLGRHLAAPA